MYKKIKNGSFMNWIWFIIAILPLLLLVIYSSNFIFNKQTNSYKIDNLLNLQNDFVETEENETSFENNNIYYYTILSNQNYNSNYFIYNYSTANGYSTNVFNLTCNNEDLYGLNFKAYIELVNFSNDEGIKVIYDIFSNGGVNSDYLSEGTILELNGTFNEDDNFSVYLDASTIPNTQWNYNFTLKIFISLEQFPKELIKEQNNWFYVLKNNNFYDYLISINNTLQSNGFISSAFLNLSQFFGVNNIYYSLACYYIEYLLVIALLHLAFDVLYMLPNICHKFMEKIGGERD